MSTIRKSSINALTISIACASLTTLSTYADSVTISNTFTSGTAASASEVNQNFTDVKNAVDDNDGRITVLESASSGSAMPVTIDCNTAGATAIQDAINNAAASGDLVITIDGSCSENVVVKRDNVTLQSALAGGSLAAASSSSAVITLDGARRVIIDGLTITGGMNGISVINNSSVSLNNNTISGSIVDAGSFLPTASALFANKGGMVDILDDNSFTSGQGGDDVASVFLLGGSHAQLVGANNSFNGGPTEPLEDDPGAMLIVANSSFIQTSIGANNTITGYVELEHASQGIFNSIAINGNIDIFNTSILQLTPLSSNAITVMATEIEAGNSSTLDFADDGFPVTVNSGGVAGTLRLLDHSSLGLYDGSLINMDVELFRSSSIDADGDSSIGGDLSVNNYSSAVFSDISGTAAANTTCDNSQAFVASPTFVDLCNPF